jgi:transcription antitermination factor NusB
MNAVIPARLSAAELAGTISRPVEEVLAALTSRGEPGSPEDIVGAELAIDIARALGVQLMVEPRDLALERLYEYEATGESVTDVGGRAGALVDGVVSSLDELDGMIESVSEHWSVARMPLIDRNILRIALHELRNDETIPTAVIVSEAVRLAQTYSTEKSSAFVNGVLSTLARTIRSG